jgi:Rps23 Pro-64 3,4-dihydroxylase Tpa1-like proline 4-hydroxylase
MTTSTKHVAVTRTQYADYIVQRLEREQERLTAEFHQPDRVPSAVVDNVLPEEMAREIFAAYPKPSEMMERKSLREHKLVAAQMDRYHPLLEEIIYAFQDPRVVSLSTEITGISGMIPDDHLYAGGISLMAHGHFLNPHLDNSHDKDRNLYRVLNLLYYVSPEWSHDSGGNLELWDHGPEGKPREIVSSFNRLALMATHKTSWHSVNKVQAAHAPRCCVSNYYFSATPLELQEYFHVTTFRGRPEEPIKDVLLQGDAVLRSSLRKVFKKGVTKTTHVYEKDPSEKNTDSTDSHS